MCGKRSCLGVEACNRLLLHELYKKFSPKVLVGVVAPSIDDTRVKYARLRLAFQESCTRLLDERSHLTRRRKVVRRRNSRARRRAALQRMSVTNAGPNQSELGLEIPIVPGIRRRIINLIDADLETRDPGRAPELVEGTFVQNFNGVVQSKFQTFT